MAGSGAAAGALLVDFGLGVARASRMRVSKSSFASRAAHAVSYEVENLEAAAAPPMDEARSTR